jgi:MYXO-CTERM domain-containing protein
MTQSNPSRARRTRRNRARAASVALLSLTAAAACSTPPTSNSSSPGVSRNGPSATATAPTRVTLTRSMHPLALPALDQGRRDGAIPVAGSIYFKPSAAQQADRDALVEAVQSPTSPSYHKWLGADAYAARFGATASDIARVSAWLESQGLTIDGPSRIGTRLGFRGTTAQVERAFATEFHNYVLNGVQHFAMASAPSVPGEIANVVLGLHGFHDFRSHAQRKAVPLYNDPNYGLTLGPADFATLYDTQPLLTAGTNGKGVNLVIVGQTSYLATAISGFRTKFGITVTEKDILVPNTGTSAVNDSGDEGETELDLEWSSAVAQGANIIFVYTGNNTADFGVDDAAAYAIEQGDKLVPGTGNGGAQIISESYGGCDALEASDADVAGEIAAAANLEGITYVASSGDSGAAGCYGFGIGGLFVGPPSSLPGVTGVGGTQFPAAAQAAPFFVNDVAVEYPIQGGASLEAVWNDSKKTPESGGGGKSTIFPKPFFQQGGLTPNDNARDVPDVSLTASPNEVGYEVDQNGTFEPYGGTSASTPSFAGILAMVNQAVAAKGAPLGLGNINPMLYTLNKSAPTAFHDIVAGNNIVPCRTTKDPQCPASGSYGGYSATAGYDLATGLGTIDAANLVKAWTALTPTTTTLVAAPTTTTVSGAITLTATVGSAATANAVGGTVTFTFETLGGKSGPAYAADAGGGFDESWTLGTVAVTPSAGTPEGATATLTTQVPPGLLGKATVVAMYNGDSHYLASWSAQSPVTVTGSTLAVTPGTLTLQPYGHATLTATGGAPPILWGQEGTDATCQIFGTAPNQTEQCTNYVSENPTQAYVEAGPKAGSITIVAIDTMGQEATMVLTVAGTAVDGGVFPTFDAGPLGGPGHPAIDAGETDEDAGTTVDAGTEVDSGSAVDSGKGVDASTGKDAGTETDSGNATDAGSETDASTADDSGTPVDAGHLPDASAGKDAGAGHDSGSGAGKDSGPTTGDDSGSPVVTDDSGSPVLSDDSGTPAPGDDSGAVGSNDDAGQTGGGGGGSSGCGCVVAGAPANDTHEGTLGALLFGLVAVVTRRRKR